MENQIDRARILADDSLKREFKAWLLDPANLVAFDRGIVLIPEKFLATGAIAPTPAGFDPSELEPEFGLMQGEDAVFSEADVVAALKKAVEGGVKLQNIRSPAGFERRLNDVTCSGCHQTRGIGGFHFPGVDWMADKPSNTTVVPASPHFFGDQIRRRDILASLRDGTPPDYSRGFCQPSAIARQHRTRRLSYYDGWGAHCYVQGKPAAGNDAKLPRLDLRRGPDLPGRRKNLAHRHVLRQKPLKVFPNCAKEVQQRAERRLAMSSPDQDRQRNRKIAENEADRQVIGDVRVSVWAIAVSVVAGVIVLGIVWAWLNR